MSEALERIAKLRDEMKAKREEINKQCKDAFQNEANSIFDKHPKLESFNWNQYTPYFNDGDTCEFGVNNSDIQVDFEGKEFEDISNYTFESDSKYYEKERAAIGLKEAVKDIFILLKSFEEDDYKFMFDDHVQITVRKSGIEVEEYSHD